MPAPGGGKHHPYLTDPSISLPCARIDIPPDNAEKLKTACLNSERGELLRQIHSKQGARL